MSKRRRRTYTRGPHITSRRGHWYGYLPSVKRSVSLHTTDYREAQARFRRMVIAEGLRMPDAGAKIPRLAGYVYFVRAGLTGPVKIGWTMDVQQRMNMLQTAHWETLHVLAVIPACTDKEREFHERFAHLKIAREWFRADQELLAVADELTADMDRMERIETG